MATDDRIYGTDLKNTFEIGPTGDFLIVSGLNNAEQRVYNRLITQLNELELFGYDKYGNQSFEVIGETDRQLAEGQIKIYTESCLKKEPVVEEIINIDVSFEGKTIYCEVEVRLIKQTHTTNLVFGLEAA